MTTGHLTMRLGDRAGRRRGCWARFVSDRRGQVGLGMITVLIAVAILAPLIAANEPIVCRYRGSLHFPAIVSTLQKLPLGTVVFHKDNPFQLPSFNPKKDLEVDAFAVWPPIPFGPRETGGHSLSPPSSTHWLGTDDIGRDLAARMVHGTVVSIQVGFVAMGIAGLIGVILGGVAGHFGGWVDVIISRIIEIVMCFPEFFLILSVMVWLEPSIINVMVVIGMTRWTGIARFVRAEFMRLKYREFVIAAEAAGAGNLRIMWKHLLPNAMAPVMVTVVFGIAQAVLIEAALSWLGFGVQPPRPSWGSLLRDAFGHLNDAPYMVYPPCIAIFLTVMAYNLAGDALRDAIDPRTHNE